MAPLIFLALAAVIVLVGALILWVVQRPRGSALGGITEFSSRMDALGRVHEKSSGESSTDESKSAGPGASPRDRHSA